MNHLKMKTTAVAAVLFDLDGTLLDTLDDIADAVNAVLHCAGFPAHPPDAYRQFIGDGVRKLIARALPPEAGAEETIDRCVRGFQKTYETYWNVKTRPYAGVPELLDALGRRGLALAVLSNKPDAFTRRCVDRYLGANRFRVVVGHREGRPRKPDPAAALDIAAAVDVPTEQFLYLGDSAVDMQTARAAGMTPLGAAWGFRSVEEIQSAGAAAVLDRPMDLLNHLGA